MVKRLIFIALLNLLLVPLSNAFGQQASTADVATYQLGVIAEILPGSNLTYVLTVTNFGPGTVESFYVLDGWTINAQGISAFDAPIADPDFGAFTLVGTWGQNRSDQDVLAWLLNGRLEPGATIEFDWKVHVDSAYRGGLVNWAKIVTEGELDGVWQPRATTATTPPPLTGTLDPIADNNRTSDGVTVVTESPGGAGVDLALYQTGLLSQIQVGKSLDSLWLVTNLGPQPVQQFYLVAGWSLNSDGGSILTDDSADPDFGDFQVVGRWRQTRTDEELWLWQLQGKLLPGASAAFRWARTIDPAYRGDLVNWAQVSAQAVPDGNWTARLGTNSLPQPLENGVDTVPGNDRSSDGLTTIVE